MKIGGIFISLLLLLFIGCNNPPEVEPTNNQISVYPNPTSQAIKIRIVNPTNLLYTLHVFGPNGNTVFYAEENLSGPEYTVDLSDKPAGIYQVVVKKGEIKTIQRVIKI